jgi:hypothetical protein
MDSLAKEKGKGKDKQPFVPDTPIRAIGRLLWRSELEGESFVRLSILASVSSRGERLAHSFDYLNSPNKFSLSNLVSLLLLCLSWASVD